MKSEYDECILHPGISPITFQMISNMLLLIHNISSSMTIQTSKLGYGSRNNGVTSSMARRGKGKGEFKQVYYMDIIITITKTVDFVALSG